MLLLGNLITLVVCTQRAQESKIFSKTGSTTHQIENNDYTLHSKTATSSQQHQLTHSLSQILRALCTHYQGNYTLGQHFTFIPLAIDDILSINMV